VNAPAREDGWPFPGLLWGSYPQRALPLAAEARAGSVWHGHWPRLARAIARQAGGETAPVPGDALARRLLAAAQALRASHGVAVRWQQVLAARALLDQRLVEMATGEGKTYALALAAGAAAQAGTPVHVVTANDYLAERDAAALAPFYARLGLRCDFVTEPMDAARRRMAYAADVTYCTARELGFDYMRDATSGAAPASALQERLAPAPGREPPVLRGLCMALLDEADTLLVDEARTPLVLSQARHEPGEAAFLRQAWDRAARLREPQHYRLSADTSRVRLLPAGRAALESWPADPHPLHGHAAHREQAVLLALTARHVLRPGRDYIVQGGKVALVDETTGRASSGRAWSRGLHQMVELKEGVAATTRGEPVAQLTYQRFFIRYHRLAGVSGTLREARRELKQVYGLKVLRVPPQQPSRVRHFPPRVFANGDALWQAACERALALAGARRPVLIGAASVADAERLSACLRAAGAPHALLHAAMSVHETDVVAQAGWPGRITIATSMAGRGTDILLAPEAQAAGGLHVILCQLNASTRIDRQFTGRAGRQGQPGSADWYVAMDFPLAVRRTPALLSRWIAGTLWPGWALRIYLRAIQRLEGYTQSQQRVTLCRWAATQEQQYGFSRDVFL
jgi:preprotein translocase subunit SecA